GAPVGVPVAHRTRSGAVRPWPPLPDRREHEPSVYRYDQDEGGRHGGGSSAWMNLTSCSCHGNTGDSVPEAAGREPGNPVPSEPSARGKGTNIALGAAPALLTGHPALLRRCATWTPPVSLPDDAVTGLTYHRLPPRAPPRSTTAESSSSGKRLELLALTYA